MRSSMLLDGTVKAPRHPAKRQADTGKDSPRIQPRIKATLRALDGRRCMIESFGPRTPTFITVTGGKHPEGAWLSARQLRRLMDTIRRILK